MKMNLKGTIAAVALVFGMSAVSAEGLSFGGYFRTGAKFNLDSDASKAEAKYAEGNYYGGGDRLRLNIAYDSGSAGVTFRFQNAATGAYFSEDNVKRVEVLPYHTLGRMKYQKMGIPYRLEGVDSPTADRLANARAILECDKYTAWETEFLN